MLDQDGTTVALMAEDTGGLGTAVGRQFMKRRRSFTATVFSPDGGTPKPDFKEFHTVQATASRTPWRKDCMLCRLHHMHVCHRSIVPHGVEEVGTEEVSAVGLM